MSFQLICAVIFITAALIFYTIGVFSERFKKTLTKKSLILFWLGLICDTTGTLIMGQIARSGEGNANVLHAVTGAAAILLMLIHAVWATYVYLKGSEKAKASFHKFSIVVWLIWLVPYISGMFMGMGA